MRGTTDAKVSIMSPMKNEHILSWKMEDNLRELLFSTLKKHNETVCMKIRLLHAVAAADAMGGALSQHDIKLLCPDYPGKLGVVPLISSLIREHLPEVVYYDRVSNQAMLEPYLSVEIECSWCTEEDFEESLICPNCYGQRKIAKRVAPPELTPYETYDVFVCDQVTQSLVS